MVAATRLMFIGHLSRRDAPIRTKSGFDLPA
jgi:hypothetical protein